MFIAKTFRRVGLSRRPNEKCLSSISNISKENPVVAVKQGKLKGSVKKCLDGSPYYSFKGIPYAQPPVGELRFRAPLPIKPWTGIRDAIEHGPICSQCTSNFIEGSEDCLFLNVYTKSLQPNSKIPVMVYIHGGSHMSGSGNSEAYGPEYFFLHDVILVTINYRLEVLGFLRLDIPEVSGNAGMKDQVLALRWVKENISAFGGDPDNITLFGGSAGSGSVTYHLLSPMSEGLFNKAIAQSGVCLSYWTIAHQLVQRAFRVGKILGKDTDHPKELLKYLRSLPASDFPRVSLKTRSVDEIYRGYPLYFTTTVEKRFEGEEQFLTKDPIDTLLEGKVNKIPLLMGYNNDEGIFMVNNHLQKIDYLNKNPSYLVPRDIATKVPAEKLKEFGERIKHFYIDNAEFSNDNIQAIVDLYTDSNFSYQTHRFLHYYQGPNQPPSYMYRFDYFTEMNVLIKNSGFKNINGACHAEELFYLFCNKMTHNYFEKHDHIKKIVYQLTKFWVDFAKTGNPTPANEGIEWRPYTSATKEYLILDHDTRLGSYADKERIEFWNKMYSDAGLPYIT